jgi:hypothetical protein
MLPPPPVLADGPKSDIPADPTLGLELDVEDPPPPLLATEPPDDVVPPLPAFAVPPPPPFPPPPPPPAGPVLPCANASAGQADSATLATTITIRLLKALMCPPLF